MKRYKRPRKKRVAGISRLSASDKFLKILEINNIHKQAIMHWTQVKNGNLLLQSCFDEIVYEFSGVDGKYIRKIGEQKFFKSFI